MAVEHCPSEGHPVSCGKLPLPHGSALSTPWKKELACLKMF